MGAATPTRPGAQYVPPNANAAILTARPNVRFLSQAVQPPSNVYVELADVLRISAASSQANEVVTVNYRLLLPSGHVTEGQSSISVTSNRAINIHDEPLAEGFLLSCSCNAAAAFSRGQTFVRIFLTNPVLGQGQPSCMLMADYVTTQMSPAHPNGRVLAPVEGPGYKHPIAISNPAAGAEWQFAIPSNTIQSILYGHATFTTAGAAGNRTPHVVSNDSGLTINIASTPAVCVPGTAYDLPFSPQPSTFAPLGTVFPIAIPAQFFKGSGSTLGSFTSGLQAGDQYSGIVFYVEEWLANV